MRRNIVLIKSSLRINIAIGSRIVLSEAKPNLITRNPATFSSGEDISSSLIKLK